MNLSIFISLVAFSLPNKFPFNNIYDKKISYKTIFDNKIDILRKNGYENY